MHLPSQYGALTQRECRTFPGLEVQFEKIRHHASHVTSKVRLRDSVATFGVDHELKFFARFLEFVGELHGVGEVDIIIHCPVNQ